MTEDSGVRTGDHPGPVEDGGRLSYAIFQLARAHRGYAARLLRDLGLHPGQELLLMRLLDRDGQTQSELLAAVGLDHSTVSKSLRRMQEADLLTREPAEHDRRAMRVWLTDRGRAMRGDLEDMWSTLERASVGDLDADTVERFIATSGAIRRSIVERGATPPPVNGAAHDMEGSGPYWQTNANRRSTTMSDGSNAQPAQIPPDDPRRDLTLARPEDRGLRHISVVGDTYTILLDGEQTAGRFCLIDMHVPPGGGPPPHRHDFEETFHVLGGEIEVTFRGERSVVRAGETVNVPANAPHAFTNASERPARLLCVCAPPGQEEFFEAIGEPVASRTAPPPELDDAARAERAARAEELAPRYRTELLIP